MSELNLQINMDEPVQLLFISDALRSIALHQGADVSLLNSTKTTVTHQAGDMSVTKTVEFEQPVKVEVEAIVTPPTLDEQCADIGIVRNEAVEATVITPPTLDELAVSDMDNALAATTNIVTPPVVTEAPVIPWDGRIHSKNKTQNKDGSFKYRRQPSEHNDASWIDYKAAVEIELTELMNPTTQLEGVTPNADVVIDSQDPSAVFGAPVTETPPVVTETPPVVVTPPIVTETPPVVVTPPVVTETPPVVVEADTPKTFGDLMKFVTTNKVKLTPDACQEVLTAHGVAKWPLLAVKLGAQPEFMNTIYPALKALL